MGEESNNYRNFMESRTTKSNRILKQEELTNIAEEIIIQPYLNHVAVADILSDWTSIPVYLSAQIIAQKK